MWGTSLFGSGFGRLCVAQLAPMGFKKVVGIEINKSLTKFANIQKQCVANNAARLFGEEL